VEANLNNLGFKYNSINSKMGQEERTRLLEDFNNPDSDTMILLMTSALGAVSVNLQTARRVICMEIPISFYILCQILGRVNRIGQTQEQYLELLFCYSTFDQYAMNRMFKKMIPTLAGEGHCLTDPDPVVDAENKLMLALGVAYSMADATAWATPPWNNCQDHIKFADKMREITGRWLYTSDAEIVRRSSQAAKYVSTPSKEGRAIKMFGTKGKKKGLTTIQNLPQSKFTPATIEGLD